MTRILHLVLSRWFVPLAIVCGLLSAPLAMASGHAQPSRPAQAMSHCADTGENGSGEHAPVKQFRCLGACIGIAPGAVGLACRVTLPRPVAAIPPAASLTGILIGHDPPPPRAI